MADKTIGGCDRTPCPDAFCRNDWTRNLYWLRSCVHTFGNYVDHQGREASTNKTGGEVSNGERLEKALNMGFDVDYSVVRRLCVQCNTSGGICGSSSTSQFSCLCRDKSYPYSCQKSGMFPIRLLCIHQTVRLARVHGLMAELMIEDHNFWSIKSQSICLWVLGGSDPLSCSSF